MNLKKDASKTSLMKKKDICCKLLQIFKFYSQAVWCDYYPYF